MKCLHRCFALFASADPAAAAHRLVVSLCIVLITAPSLTLHAAALGPPMAVLPEAGVLRQGQPAVARVADGRYVVVWADEQRNQIVGRRFAADGAPLDGGFVIGDGTIGGFFGFQVQHPAVAIDAAGNFVVAWLARRGSGSRRAVDPPRVLLRRYTADGVPAGDPFTAEAADSQRHQGPPAIAMQADGRFVLAWSSATIERNAVIGVLPVGFVNLGLPVLRLRGQRILVRRYDAEARALGDAVTVDTRRDADVLLAAVGFFILGNVTGVGYVTELDERVAVTIAADGRHTVGWHGRGDVFVLLPNLAFDTLWQRRFDAPGRPLAAAEIVDVDAAITPGMPNTFHSAPAYAGRSDGSGHVAWTETLAPGSTRQEANTLRLRLLQADGRASGEPLTISTDAAFSFAPAVAPLPDGGIAVCWVTASNPRGIRLQRLRADGTPIDREPLPVTAIGAPAGLDLTGDSAPQLAADAAGGLVVTWSARDPSVNSTRTLVLARRYGPP